MICSLLLDPDDSVDFPGNTATALGRPLAAYPLLAARSAAQTRRHYVVTASPPVKAAALQYGAIILDPPAAANGAAGAESLLMHGYQKILEELEGEPEGLELLVVLLAQAPTVTKDVLDAGIEALQAKPELDCALSVSSYNRWNPYCAKREGVEGLLEPYVPTSAGPVNSGTAAGKADVGAPAGSRGDVWYPDWSALILRPRCLQQRDGPPPHPWMGRKILPLKQWGGGPIDYHWQIPSLEYWLKKHGYSDQSASLEPQPKPQPAPKAERR
jgi:hypothetical protein